MRGAAAWHPVQHRLRPHVQHARSSPRAPVRRPHTDGSVQDARSPPVSPRVVPRARQSARFSPSRSSPDPRARGRPRRPPGRRAQRQTHRPRPTMHGRPLNDESRFHIAANVATVNALVADVRRAGGSWKLWTLLSPTGQKAMFFVGARLTDSHTGRPRRCSGSGRRSRAVKLRLRRRRRAISRGSSRRICRRKSRGACSRTGTRGTSCRRVVESLTPP